MIEYTSTRHNLGVDPHLHVWEWQIPVYLFLGGLVAGLMILSGYHILRAQWDKDKDHGHYVTAPLVSIILLSLGMGALFLDLSHKLYVWRLYLTFEIASPMSWGAWILLGVYPVLFGSLCTSMPSTMPWLFNRIPWSGSMVKCSRKHGVLHFLGFANVILGVMLGVYTGILLSALGARPLWSSALLGPLFLFSGLSTGAATLHILSHFTGDKSNRGGYRFSDAIGMAMVHWIRPKEADESKDLKLAQADNSFLTVELFILVLFIIGMLSSTAVHQQAVAMILTGPYAASFWVFVVGIGILIPLLLQFLQGMRLIKQSMLPALLVLFGGLILRFIFVFAGQESSWMMAMTGH